MLCKHLEIDEFGRYSVAFDGRTKLTMLQRCSYCGAYLTMDGKAVPRKARVKSQNTAKANMRTLTVQINSELYDKLLKLVDRETGGDSTKLMSEIVGLGIKQYNEALG